MRADRRLRDALRPFVIAARKATASCTRTRATDGDAAETAAIQAWAKKQGHQISDRSRTLTEIREAYHDAAGGQP